MERIDESCACYLSQLETTDRHGDAVPEAKIARLEGKIKKLKEDRYTRIVAAARSYHLDLAARVHEVQLRCRKTLF